jgi:hypothetical protein
LGCHRDRLHPLSKFTTTTGTDRTVATSRFSFYIGVNLVVACIKTSVLTDPRVLGPKPPSRGLRNSSVAMIRSIDR